MLAKTKNTNSWLMGVFLGLHEKDALIGVTCEVLEKMYNEYNLEHGGKNKITKATSCGECSEYIVTYSDSKCAHDLHTVRCDTNNNLCIIVVVGSHLS